jgi:hypothetical protein
MGEQATLDIRTTHSDRLVHSSQNGDTPSWDATSVDAYRNGGRHLEYGRGSISGEAGVIVGRIKSANVFVAQRIAQLEDSW